MPDSKLPTPPTAAADVRVPSHAPSDAPSHAQSQALSHPSATLEAVLERITYANEETGYTVARVSARGVTSSGELLTVVGNLLGAQPGESLRLEGRWKSHPQYGRQFEVQSFTTVLPATIQGIRRYLGSGLIKGIGPKMAERIVAHFATDTLRVIEEEPARLVEVPGLGPKRTAMITRAWEEQKAIKEVMLFLQGVGVSTSLAVRIYKTYRDAAIAIVKNEPYRLAADVWGIGFKTADTIAQSLGIPHDSPERVKAGLQFTLSEASEEGHCYLPREELLRRAAEILGVETALVAGCLEELVREGGVVRERLAAPAHDDSDDSDEDALKEEKAPIDAIYLVPFHRAEVSLANGIRRLLQAPQERLPAFRAVDWEAAFGWLQQQTGSTLAPEQAEAVQLALTRKVAVLTGGPGCGKSFTVRSVVLLAKAKRAKVLLTAPTGRAAKRLEELVGTAGVEASTLHRLLQLRPGGDAAFDRDRPLDADLIVVDEASMLDVLLANTLVKAIPPGAHLLFVGDVDQLPSVGAGEVLRDLLGAGADAGAGASLTGAGKEIVPSVRLTRIFRQAQHSGVVTNAHRINAGHLPVAKGLDDFFLFAEEDAERAAELTVDIVAHRLPTRFGLDARRDVQVLCPMHRGPAGAGALNERLQEALTPARPGTAERRYGGRVYRVGDKVTQLRNNYDKEVFNGALGTVTALSLEEQELHVLLDDGRQVRYAFDELDELTHAYAISIHRSQGSEYPCVVVPLTTNAWLMLQRNLLYTAVTRAKRLVVLVGSKRALAKAVRTVGAGRRFTGLRQRLQTLGATRRPGAVRDAAKETGHGKRSERETSPYER
jgi:exodeoxyribonuclease V alpha subunit